MISSITLGILREALTMKMRIWDLLCQAERRLGITIDEQTLDDIGAGLNSPEDSVTVAEKEFRDALYPQTTEDPF